jgi:hypothetical protein
MRSFYFVLLVGLAGCQLNTPPQPGWHIQNNTVCFSDRAGVASWKHCASLSADQKTNCQSRSLTDQFGHPFDRTPVDVFYHSPNGVSKVKVISGEYQDKEFYCPTERVWK